MKKKLKTLVVTDSKDAIIHYRFNNGVLECNFYPNNEDRWFKSYLNSKWDLTKLADLITNPYETNES